MRTFLITGFLLFMLFPKAKANGLHGMTKTKFLPPYDQNGKTTFSSLQGKSGVYLIKEHASEIVYVGHSKSNLYKTMYRHFQKWDDPTQYRVSYSNPDNYTVRVILTTPAQAQRLEKYLIHRYQPRDNEEKIKNMKEGEGETEYAKYQEADEAAPF